MVSHLVLQGLLLLSGRGVADDKTHKQVGVLLQPAWHTTVILAVTHWLKGAMRLLYDDSSPVQSQVSMQHVGALFDLQRGGVASAPDATMLAASSGRSHPHSTWCCLSGSPAYAYRRQSEAAAMPPAARMLAADCSHQLPSPADLCL